MIGKGFFCRVIDAKAFVGTSASRQTSNYLKGEGRKFASDDIGYDGLFGAFRDSRIEKLDGKVYVF